MTRRREDDTGDSPRAGIRNPTIGIFPILVAGFALYYVSSVGGERFETVGYGLLCSSFVFALTAILIARRYLSGGNPLSDVQSWLEGRPRALRENAIPTTIFVSLLVYAYAQTLIGFMAASVATYGWLLWFLGYRKPLRWALATIALGAISHIVLLQMLNVPVPRAPFFE